MGVVKGAAYLPHPQSHQSEFLGKSLVCRVGIVIELNSAKQFFDNLKNLLISGLEL